MKKLLLTLIILSMALTLTLASCTFDLSGVGGSGEGSGTEEGGNEGNDGGNGTKPEAEPENLIYSEASELYIFFSDNLASDTATRIISELDSKRSTIVSLDSVDSAAKKHEIVIGNTDRDISRQALLMMDRINKTSEDELSYLVYSDGASVALVWEEDKEGVMEQLAVEHFIENYVKKELILPKKVASSETINLLDAYYKALDTEYKSEKWAELEAVVGKELTDAYKQLYALYDSKTVVWLANLYDSDICVCVDFYGEEKCSHTKYCGTGGFYYSNSARNNMGFLPDAESTGQALSFLANSGMAYKHYNGYTHIVPQEMKDQISAFFIALQEPNGYFYHPQWGIEFTDTKSSRRSRDLNSCTTVLNAFGRRPIYDTPNGYKGTGITSGTSYLTPIFGADRTALVSRVIAASGEAYVLPQLKDLEAFKNYLKSLDITNNSYAVGNELTALGNEIVNRDKKIGTPDNPTPLMSYLINWLNDNQNPETGHWDWKEPGDNGYSAYYGTNGLLKISGIYSKAQVIMPNALTAARSAMKATVADQASGTVVEIYNTWYAIQVIVESIRLYGTEADNLVADQIVEELRSTASEAVIVSRDKISTFFKADGSASYGVTHTSETSQGCPVAIPGTNEGDVNATIIAVTGIIGHSLAALELSSYKIPIYGEYERMLFFKTIDGLGPVTKAGEAPIPDPIDFEDDEVGEESSYVTTILGPNGSAKVVKDPTDGEKGNVLALNSVPGAGDYVKISNDTVSGVANVSVFEGDFYLESTSSSYCVQILMENQYMLSFRVEGDNIRIIEVSSGNGTVALEEDLLIPARLRQWFSLKVEYYYGNHDNVRVKIYADADLSDSEDMKLYAVTDNYYDGNGVKFPDKVGNPYKQYHGASVYAMSGVSLKMYVDNLNAYKYRSDYVPETDPDNQPPINVDSPDREGILYDFEGAELPEGFITSGEEFVKVENGALGLSGVNQLASSLTIPVNKRTNDANCAVSSFDITVDECSDGNVMLIKGIETKEEIFGFYLTAVTDGTERYLTLRPTGSVTGDPIEGARIPLGEKTKLTLAYYHGEDVILIYVNDEFIGASNYLYVNGFKRKMKELVLEPIVGASLCATVDNLTSEKIVADFESAVASDGEKKIYDFESGTDGVETEGAGAVRVKDGDYEMSLNSKKGAVSLNIPVNPRSKLYTAMIAEFTLRYDESTGSGTLYTFTMESESGDSIAALALTVRSGKAYLSQVGVDGVLPYEFFDIMTDTEYKIRIEAYASDGTILVYVDDTAVLKTCVFASDTPADIEAARLTVKSGNAKGAIALDDLRFETIYAVLYDVTVEGKANPEKDTVTGLDYESSASSSIPSVVEPILRSVGSFVDVVRVFNSYRNEYSNALSFGTAVGNNDTLSFKSGTDLSDYKGVAFETDMKIDYTAGNPTHRISFLTADGKSAGYMILIRVENRKIKLIDVSGIADSGLNMCTVAENIELGEWFNLRVECYEGNANTVRFKIIVNGVTVAVSDNYVGSELGSASPVADLHRMEFYSMNATDTVISFDNTKIEGLDGSCTDRVTVTYQ